MELRMRLALPSIKDSEYDSLALCQILVVRWFSILVVGSRGDTGDGCLLPWH
jgi:hypothetical protein